MRFKVVTAVLAVTLACGISLGQDEIPDATRFADWFADNQSELTRFRWTERFAIEQNGTPEAVRLYRVRFNAEGLVKRRIVGTEVDSLDTDRKPSDPLGRQVELIDDETETGPDLPDDLLQLIESYIHVRSELAHEIYSRAEVVDELEPPSDEVEGVTEPLDSRPDRQRFRIDDALIPGDRVEFWVDHKSFHLRRLVLVTTLDDVPVTVTTEFTDLPDGPTYPARSLIETGEEGAILTLQTESFDYSGRR